jgi:general stress protein 26
MQTDPRNPADVEFRLWEEIESHKVGMLNVVSAQPIHAQPMTAFPERARRQLWFFTRMDSPIALQIGDGRMGMFTYQRNDVQACMAGLMHIERDPVRIERYWNAVVAAWNPEGRADPRLTMISFDCEDAQVWVSDVGPMRFAWEIAKANATRHAPDVGGRTHLDFH